MTKTPKTEHGYWRSLADLNGEAEIRDSEFAEGGTGPIDTSGMNGLSRRRFMALLGASAALAGTGCDNYRGHGKIVSYSKQPDTVVIGRPNYYASSCNGCADACGVLVKTREGRPIKVDGNPEHPVNQGKICHKGQASVLALYHPERIRKPLLTVDGKKQAVEWAKAEEAVLKSLKGRNGKPVAIVTHTVTSPSFARLLESLKSDWAAEIISYEQFDAAARDLAWTRARGQGLYPLIRWEDARLVVSVEANGFSDAREQMRLARGVAKNRSAEEEFSRIYALEGNYSLSGANADIHVQVKPSDQAALLSAALHEILVVHKQTPHARNTDLLKLVQGFDKTSVSARTGVSTEVIAGLAEDLLKYRGAGIVFAGGASDEATQMLAQILNEVLGNIAIFDIDASPVRHLESANMAKIVSYVENVRAGRYAAVIHINTNPVYDFPRDLDYAGALKGAGTVVSFAMNPSETAEASGIVLPLSHDFESWGDAQVRTGLMSLRQPVIATLYGTRQAEACLLAWQLGKDFHEDIWHDYVKNRWEKEVHPRTGTAIEFSHWWNAALHDGFVKIEEYGQIGGKFDAARAASFVRIPQADEGVEVVFTEAYSLGDGRHAHNGWLQELPHPISRVVWDNYAAISYGLAESLKVDTGDQVSLEIEGRKMILPVLVQPSQQESTIAVQLGYGRSHSGVIAEKVGFDAAPLMSSKGGISAYVYKASVKKAAGTYDLASVQDHHPIELTGPEAFTSKIQDAHLRRQIIQENTLHNHREDPHWLAEINRHKEKHVFSIYEEEQKYTGIKWAMSIDLNKCNGCGTCVVACSSENNVPVIGKEQVKKGREMHWLRIDRYYSGDPKSAKSSFQPMLCQHCDNAPCENVCPVGATAHSPEGLNDMAYNRCVGTRYCGNNCPYKVRRFNFHDFRRFFHDSVYYQEPMQLAQNPEVTVRSRGVMEKCSFCVQRISEGRAQARRSQEEFIGQGVTAACQDACPSGAIEFGNVNDKNSGVAKARKDKLSYHVLQELNVKPNVTYLARLRNSREEVKS